jgi:hypothetical protein
MAPNAIIQKLTSAVSVPVNSEQQVVYILAEVRKLDELEGKKAPQALRMFLHWALHVNLEGPGTIKTFVERIDDVVAELLTTGNGTREAIAAESALFREVTYFDEFRQQLRLFFSDHGIPTTLCDDAERWFDFLGAYANVIEDGSLIGQKKMVERVTFTRGRVNPAATGAQLAHKWMIYFKQPFKNSSRIQLSVQGPADGKNAAHDWSLF